MFPLVHEANFIREPSFQPQSFVDKRRLVMCSFLYMFGAISISLFQLCEEIGSLTFLISGSYSSVHVRSELVLSKTKRVTEGLMLVTQLDSG